MNELVVIHALFRLAYDLIRILALRIFGGDTHRNARMYRHSLTLFGNLANARTDLRRSRKIRFRKDNCKLIAAPAGDNVVLPAGFPDDVRGGLEQFVSLFVSENVID